MIRARSTFYVLRSTFQELCGCADPHRCHRALAADFLAERLGAEVIHLAAPARPPRDDGGQLMLPGL